MTKAVMQLEADTLYVLLYMRGEDASNGFHWALYLHLDSDSDTGRRQGGLKYHIRDVGQGWMTDHVSTLGVHNELFLIGAVGIARVPKTRREDLDRLVKQDDAELLTIPVLTCRTWVLRVLDRLHDAGLVQESSEEVEKRAKAFAVEHFGSALLAQQPRPVQQPPDQLST